MAGSPAAPGLAPGAIRWGRARGSLPGMSDAPSPAKRQRRTTASLTALRHLAREAAEAGEPMREIARRLDLPWSTLTKWAREDGFRHKDIAARQAAAAKAQDEADHIRQQAELAARRTILRDEEDEEGGDEPFTPRSQTDEEITLARARVGALLEAGYIPEAEQDMRAARRLTSLQSFAAPVRAATEAATQQMRQAQMNAALYRAALQVCACWEEGDTPPDHLPWIVSATFQKRLAIAREVVLAVDPDDEGSDQELTEHMIMLAAQGWFRNFHPLLREAITTLTLQGNHALAEKVGGFLKAEQAALPTLIQWCHANGYGYYGEV